ncbi:hypothetical protein OAN307_c08030 [Octadecabacter antarcticus 307]|uniref:DUF3489 family protein n=1 Tax=Octadecabacter antarcticus 307 TaxID=391626 RepID=M9R448_9RHOB|nr:DUF3489 domain-containing protein [Octadecabacter antarcticus]AGI66528.1 hypothetical protein OAN307_c08030 [Octadecabacter antarcticus 307]
MTQQPKPGTSSGISPVAGKIKREARCGGTTKKAQLIQMLSRKAGGDVAAISEKFGWLPHTTRAALTGLRKAGYEITSLKAGNGKPLRYHIMPAPKLTAKTDVV